MDTSDPGEQLEMLITAAGASVAEGYSVEGDVVAWVLDGARRIVVVESDPELWLFVEVGLKGGGVYPEDDLAEEADIELAPDHVLAWDDNIERAVLARRVGVNVNAQALAGALAAFGALAEEIERRLTSLEDLDVVAVPPGDDPLERGIFVPPPQSTQEGD